MFYHVTDISVYLGRHRGGSGPPLTEPISCMHSNLEWYIFRFTNIRNSSAWGRDYKIRPQARSFHAFIDASMVKPWLGSTCMCL